MGENDEEEVFIPVNLDADTVAHYGRRAQAAGRTLEEQILYELEVNHRFRLPDPGDTEAAHRRNLFQRIHQRRILHG